MAPRLLPWVAAATLLVALVAAGQLSRWNLVDDALILCRFAENAARGAAGAFNPGVRFESHSSPLWVALLTAGEWLAMDLPYLARALGVLCALGLVLVMAGATRILFPTGIAFAATVLVAGDSGLATWALSGLETSGFALLLLAGGLLLYAALRQGARRLDLLLGGVAGALSLARPEGILLGALLVGVRLSFRGPSGRGRGAALVFAAVAGALVVGRWLEQGSPVPGSVAAKLTPTAESLLAGGLAALHFLARRLPLVVGALAAWPLVRRSGDPALRRTLVALAAAVLLLLLEVVVAGGDWMGNDRLTLAAVPLLALMAGFAIAGRLPAARPGGPALFFLVALSLAGSWWGRDRIPEHGHAARRLGTWLARNCAADTRLGVAAAGAVPYASGFWTVDALGITDPAMARTPPPANAPWKPGHMRYDLERFLDERPDVIVWEFGAAWSKARMTEASDGVPARRGDYRRELLRHPRFRADYRPMPGVPAEAERYFSVFRRRGVGAAPSREAPIVEPDAAPPVGSTPQRTP